MRKIKMGFYRVLEPDELMHHGILGMKWGKKNGPPYPLGASDHSASEKKAGWRKSLDGGSNEKNAFSAKATAHKVAAKVYEVNEKTYSKSNKTLSSMNRTEKENQLRKAKVAQDAANARKAESLKKTQESKLNKEQVKAAKAQVKAAKAQQKEEARADKAKKKEEARADKAKKKEEANKAYEKRLDEMFKQSWNSDMAEEVLRQRVAHDISKNQTFLDWFFNGDPEMAQNITNDVIREYKNKKKSELTKNMSRGEKVVDALLMYSYNKTNIDYESGGYKNLMSEYEEYKKRHPEYKI